VIANAIGDAGDATRTLATATAGASARDTSSSVATNTASPGSAMRSR
jgi:hypothetical protein